MVVMNDSFSRQLVLVSHCSCCVHFDILACKKILDEDATIGHDGITSTESPIKQLRVLNNLSIAG